MNMYRYFQIGILGYLFLALLLLLVSGKTLYYDELLHAVNAQKIIYGSTFLAGTPESLGHDFFGRRIPLMTLMYVGPLKSYFLSVWFFVFGDAVIFLRLFGVFVGIFYLFLVFLFCARFLSPIVGTVAVALLLSDPSFMLSRIFDWGPVVIQDILKIILLVITFEFLKSRSETKWLYALFGVLSAILMWDKLNGWWWLVGLLSVYLVGMRDNLGALLRMSFFVIGGFVIGLLPLVLFFYKRPWFYEVSQESFRFFERLALSNQDQTLLFALLQNYLSDYGFKLQTFWQVLQGVAIPNYILLYPVSFVGGFGVFFVATLIMCGYLLVRNGLDGTIMRLVLLMLVVFGCVLLTNHANAIHHWLMLYPLPHIVVAFVGVYLWKRFTFLTALLIGLYIVQTIFLYSTIVTNLSFSELKPYWDGEEMETLTHSLLLFEDQRAVIALDWGISLPVAFLSEGIVRVSDLQPFYRADCQKLVKWRVDNAIFVRYSVDTQVFNAYYDECGWVLDDLENSLVGQYEILFVE
jgi:hypothetical protein